MNKNQNKLSLVQRQVNPSKLVYKKDKDNQEDTDLKKDDSDASDQD